MKKQIAFITSVFVCLFSFAFTCFAADGGLPSDGCLVEALMDAITSPAAKDFPSIKGLNDDSSYTTCYAPVFTDEDHLYLPAQVGGEELNAFLPGGAVTVTERCVVGGDVIKTALFGEKTAKIIGDADGDGKVSAKDARLLLRSSAMLGTIDEAFARACDTDGDGEISAYDARSVLCMSAGLDLPCLFSGDACITLDLDETFDASALGDALKDAGFEKYGYWYAQIGRETEREVSVLVPDLMSYEQLEEQAAALGEKLASVPGVTAVRIA